MCFELTLMAIDWANHQVKMKSYDNADSILKALFGNKVDAVVINRRAVSELSPSIRKKMQALYDFQYKIEFHFLTSKELPPATTEWIKTQFLKNGKLMRLGAFLEASE